MAVVNETLLTLTTDIVSAYLGHNKVQTADVPQVIQAVYGALACAGEPGVVREAKPEPAVSIRSSVKPNAITCLECGEKMKMLKQHLRIRHNLTPAEYRRRWGLSADYPIVSPEYSAKRRELAVTIGLGRTPGGGRKPRGKPKEAAPATRVLR